MIETVNTRETMSKTKSFSFVSGNQYIYDAAHQALFFRCVAMHSPHLVRIDPADIIR